MAKERRIDDHRRAGNGPRPIAGSVSIYFIAATAGFVLLTGLLIDFGRIAAFRKQAELAVRSGARSALSAYDPELYGRYGLFARGGNPADELFKLTLERNLEPGSAAAFTLLDASWTESSVTESRPLASHEVFRRQVLEEMKYKAPIDLTMELLSRFKGISPAVKEAAAAVDALEAMRKAYDSRENALDRALQAQRSAGGALAEGGLKELAPESPSAQSGGITAGRASHVADAALMYDDYVAKRASDAARAEARSLAIRQWEARKQAAEAAGMPFDEDEPSGNGAQHTAAIAAYETSVRKLAAAMEAAAAQGIAAANERLAQAEAARGEAMAANAEMRRIAAEASARTNGSGTGGSEADAGSDEASIGADKADSIADLLRMADELALPDDYFAEYGEELAAQREAGGAVADAARQAAGALASLPGSSDRGREMRELASALQPSLAAYRARYGSGGQALADRERSFEAHRSGDAERKQLEREADREWSGVGGFLGMFKGKEAEEADMAAFGRLHELYKANLAWNEAEEEKREAAGQAADAEAGRGQAMARAGGWLDALGEAAAGKRDDLYLAEYTADRFTHAEPSEVRELLSGQEGGLPPERQQAEYVLYGLNSPMGNLAAAYGEIFAVRLAIRTMEGLIECRAYGHPLVVLAAALVYAIQHALADMNGLLGEGKIPLSKYAQLDTTYLDYLRLFLLLHGGAAERLARCIAIVETETGLSLERTYTYVSGEGTASLKLWFYPGLTRLLNRTGGWGGVVREGRYEATYTADDSY